jgi:fructose-specific phosphotransferase system IIA component
MKMMDFLQAEAIKVSLEAKNKKEVIEELLELLVQTGKVKDKSSVLNAIFEREKIGCTAIGKGVAIPHAKSDAVKEVTAACGISFEGVDFGCTVDDKPVHLFFLLVAPNDAAGPHLKALARLSRLLHNSNFRESLMKATTKEELFSVISEEDRKRQ